MSRVFNIQEYQKNASRPRLALGGTLRLSGSYDKLILKVQKLTKRPYYANALIHGKHTFKSIQYGEEL